ncbi:MAG: response regulator transcription factor [Bacillota bacterium]|nr:response regulator transcription factor [Bacillota bacterium]
MNKNIKVITFDNRNFLQLELQKRIKQAPYINLVAATESWQQLSSEIQKGTRPDVIFFNIIGTEINLDKLKVIKKEQPQIQYIALIEPDSLQLQQLIDTGVIGFLAPGFDSQQLIRAIEISAKGEIFLHPHIAEGIVNRLKNILSRLGAEEQDQELVDKLSPREKEVLTLIAQGYSNIETGKKLFISPKTVRSHVRNILDKLGFNDKVRIALFAVRTGLIDSENSLY